MNFFPLLDYIKMFFIVIIITTTSKNTQLFREHYIISIKKRERYQFNGLTKLKKKISEKVAVDLGRNNKFNM